MHLGRYKDIAVYTLIAFHVSVVYFVILFHSKLSGFIESTASLQDFMKLNGGTSIIFLTCVGLLIHRKGLLSSSYSPAIFRGLIISGGLWIGIMTIGLLHGFYSNPFFEMEIFYWPLYPIGYFQEWISYLFRIHMGNPLTPTSITVFVAYTLMYQMCYAILPIGIILCLKKFMK